MHPRLNHVVSDRWTRWIGSFLVTAAAGLSTARADVFVADTSSSSIRVFATEAHDDVAPIRVIGGEATGVGTPFGVAVDPIHTEVYAASLSSPGVQVFDLWANGNLAPKRSISGPSTKLVTPIGLVVDSVHDELFVFDFGSDPGILVFARTADGNTAPLRVLGGNLTGWDDSSLDLALDLVHDELWVASRGDGNSSSAVLAFPRTAQGNVAPIRVIQGLATKLVTPYGITFDPVHDEVLVSDPGSPGGSILAFARTASGNVPPLRHLVPSPSIDTLTGVEVDVRRDELLTCSQSQHLIAAFARTATTGATALRTVSGNGTGLAQPSLLALGPELILVDDFESGDTSAWTDTTP